MNYSRRQFQLVTLTAAVSTALTAVSSGSTQEKEAEELRRGSVLRGLHSGINFKGAVREVLTMLNTYSMEQTLLGGCVLSLAADHDSDTVHILVMANPLKVAKALPNLELGEMHTVNGNSIAFSYNGQQFFIEHLSKELYQKRLRNLTPGSKDNDFYIEFAHQLITYNVQSRRHQDPKNAIGRSSKIELKRVSSAEDSASVVKTLVESKRHGLALPKEEQRTIDNTLQRGLRNSESSIAATATFLSQLTLYTQYNEERTTRRLLDTQLAKDTLGEVLGCDTNKLSKTFHSIRRRAPRDTPDSELWLSAIQCLEQTGDSQCHETLSLLTRRQTGHQILSNMKGSINSTKLLKGKNIKRFSIKQKRRRHK